MSDKRYLGNIITSEPDSAFWAVSRRCRTGRLVSGRGVYLHEGGAVAYGWECCA
jgi:hypothetical protein